MRGISILMYHQVGDFAPMKTHRASYCDAGRFRSQMKWLQMVGAKVLSMSQALAALRSGAPLPARAVVLSFDDGCENFHEHALPILEAFHYPAIVYAIAGKLGGSASWLAADGHPTPPLMSLQRLREVAAKGIEIGSHGMTHISLAGESPTVLRTEILDSRRALEDGLGAAVPHFCYPYGSLDLAAMAQVAEAGYASGVTCQRGAATSSFDPLALPRKAISYGDDVFGFAWKLHFKDKPKGIALRRAGVGGQT